MAARPKKLSDELIASLPYAAGKAVVVPDPQLPGHRLVIRKRTKTFEIQKEKPARFGKRKTFVVKIGKAPMMTLTQARAKAITALGKIDAGEDPRTPEKAEAGAVTFAEAWGNYRQHLIRRPASPMTITAFERSFALLKSIYDTSLRTLSDDPSIAVRLHKQLSVKRLVGKTRAYTGGPVIADSAIKFLAATYNHARKRMVRGLPPDSPTSGVSPNNAKPDRAVLPSGDLPGWYAALQTVENPIQRECIWFLLLSGLRRRDACSARWDELDLERRTLNRPSPKGGATRAFDLPLSDEMVECIERARGAGEMLYPGSPWIFPASSSSGHIEQIKTAKLDVNGHGLRRTYATCAVEVGVPMEIVGRLLNHATSATVTAGYVQTGAMMQFLHETQAKISQYIVAAARA